MTIDTHVPRIYVFLNLIQYEVHGFSAFHANNYIYVEDDERLHPNRSFYINIFWIVEFFEALHWKQSMSICD